MQLTISCTLFTQLVSLHVYLLSLFEFPLFQIQPSKFLMPFLTFVQFLMKKALQPQAFFQAGDFVSQFIFFFNARQFRDQPFEGEQHQHSKCQKTYSFCFKLLQELLSIVCFLLIDTNVGLYIARSTCTSWSLQTYPVVHSIINYIAAQRSQKVCFIKMYIPKGFFQVNPSNLQQQLQIRYFLSFILSISYLSILVLYKLIQQRMRRKKPEDEMMGQAIEKASQLINLLQKENIDLKRKAERLEKQNEVLKKQHREYREKCQDLAKQYIKNAQNLANKTKQIAQLKEGLRLSDQQLKKRTNNNKELHQKLSVLTAKLKQKTKQSNQQKTKYLSLQNENEYLLKKIGKQEQKENETNLKLKEIIVQKELQIKQAVKLKQAFSRRCQELKADNSSLLIAAAQYKQRAIDSIPETTLPLPYFKQTLVKPMRCNLQYPQPPVSQILTKFIEEKLGVQPQSSIQRQLQQLNSFISYRFQHIQKLWRGIQTKFQEKQWRKINNLKDLQTASQRINAYLTQLINPQS